MLNLPMEMQILPWLAAVLLCVLALAVAPPRPSPPRPRKRPRRTRIHGVELVDEYHWLRKRDNPRVLKHLQAENEYTAAMLRHAEELQETLRREMRGRIVEDDTSAPVRWGNFFYYGRTEEGRQYSIHCRKAESLDAPEELLLDENQLAEGKPYFRLGAFKISPDHRLLAYSVDLEGSEKYTIFVKDLESGQLLKDQIPNAYDSLEWANDCRTFFYTVLDPAHRPFKVMRHRLGSEAAQDQEIFVERDEGFFVALSKTRSRKFLLIQSGSKTSSEVQFLDADDPEGRFSTIEPRREKLEYSVDHRDEVFFVVTNHQAVNFRLLSAPVESPGLENWREVIPHREDVYLHGVAAFRSHLALFERSGGMRRIRLLDFASGRIQPIEFEEPAYTATSGPNPEFDSRQLRVHYTSLVTPPSVFDVDMQSGARELIKQLEVRGGYDPGEYRTERICATAPDGTQVPVSLVYRDGLQRDGRRPLYLLGYGAYGISIDPMFNSNRLSLLDRGVVVAIAHIRGGQELGRKWYEDGKLLRKKNTFSDFVACAEQLIRDGYTSADRLAICGGSAGGLLIGAVVNQRPDLFRAAVAHVPFVDLVNTMLDASLPLTVTEYEEWGDPRQQDAFQYMLSYSPYDNVRAQKYPALLATAGLHDPRVAYWEPAKWIARLRDRKTDGRPALMKTNLEAGHGGSSGRFDRLREVALEYAFVLDQIAR